MHNHRRAGHPTHHESDTGGWFHFRSAGCDTKACDDKDPEKKDRLIAASDGDLEELVRSMLV
jgi:hypothetical protein